MKIEANKEQIDDLIHLTKKFNSLHSSISSKDYFTDKFKEQSFFVSSLLNDLIKNPTHENFKNVDSNTYKIHYFYQNMIELAQSPYIKVLSMRDCNLVDSIKLSLRKILTPYNDYIDNISENNAKKLNEISDKHDLSSTWSISEINADMLNSTFKNNEEIEISYYKDTIKLDKMSSWLDIWKASDKLIRLSGDKHHIFIEGLEPVSNTKNKFKLVTGS